MARHRLHIVFAFIALVSAGVPVWWVMTTPYRAPLDEQAIARWQRTPLVLHTHVVVHSADAGTRATDVVDAINTHLDGSMYPGVVFTLHSNPQTLGVTPQASDRATDAAMARALALASGSWPAQADLELVVLGGTSDGPATVVMGTSRHGWVQGRDAGEIGRACAAFLGGLARVALQTPTADTPPIGESLELAFSLLNAAPGDHVLTWDMGGLLDARLSLFLAPLEPLYTFRVSSEIVRHTELIVAPSRGVNGTYTLPSDTLEYFVNANQWSLTPSLTADRTWHMAVYVPPLAASPLLLTKADAPDETLPGNAFAVPTWGGVAVTNAAAGTAPGAHVHLDRATCLPLLATHVSLLRRLLSLDADVGVRRVAPRATGVALWEVDMVARFLIHAQYAETVRTLADIVVLVHDIADMRIDDATAVRVSHAMDALDRVHQAVGAAGGGLSQTLTHTRQALRLSHAAFFEPSMLALLYFPEDHKYAIYTPLFGPCVLPLVMAVIRQCRQRRRERASPSPPSPSAPTGPATTSG